MKNTDYVKMMKICAAKDVMTSTMNAWTTARFFLTESANSSVKTSGTYVIMSHVIMTVPTGKESVKRMKMSASAVAILPGNGCLHATPDSHCRMSTGSWSFVSTNVHMYIIQNQHLYEGV